MARSALAKGRIVTLPADEVLRVAELAHWEAEGYRVVPHHPGARFVCLLEPLTSEVASLAFTYLPTNPAGLVASSGLCAPLDPARDRLDRLVERLGSEPPLPPYDWQADDG